MYRITITSKTAFFKNDMTITSTQQTYECPPLSTIYGMISAAVGEKVESLNVGYVFNYKYKTEDIELITRQLDSDGKKKYYELLENRKAINRHDVLQGLFGAVPIKRDVLFDCVLYLYIDNKDIALSFINPYYTLLLGRSEDLAYVKEVKEVNLVNGKKDIIAGKTIIPFNPINTEAYGRISSMPIHISEDIPRKVMKTGIFMIIDRDNYKIQNKFDQFLLDEELNHGVYIHR